MARPLSPLKLGAAILALALYGCGGGDASTTSPPPPPPTFAVGGTVSGLIGVAVVQNNLGDDLTISANGNFAFATALANGVGLQHHREDAAVEPDADLRRRQRRGIGRRRRGDDATVTCTTNTYGVNGTITGLAGSGLVVQDNGGDDIVLSSSAVGFGFGTRSPAARPTTSR